MLKATLVLKGENYGRFRLVDAIGPTLSISVFANDPVDARCKMAQLLDQVEVLPYETTRNEIREDFMNFPTKAIDRLDMRSFEMPMHPHFEDAFIPTISWHVGDYVPNEFVCVVQ